MRFQSITQVWITTASRQYITHEVLPRTVVPGCSLSGTQLREVSKK